MKLLTTIILFLGLFAFAGCDDKSPTTKPGEESHSEDDGHGHGAEDDHEDHDDHEGHDDDESHEGHDH